MGCGRGPVWVLLLLLVTAECASVGKVGQAGQAEQRRRAGETELSSRLMGSMLSSLFEFDRAALTPQDKPAAVQSVKPHVLVQSDQTSRTRARLRDSVAKLQTSVDNLNKTWVVVFLLVIMALLLSVPSLPKLTLTYWLGAVTLCLFIGAMTAHMIGLHNAIKVISVWIANAYLDADNTLLRRIARFERRTGLRMIDIAQELKLKHTMHPHHTAHLQPLRRVNAQRLSQVATSTTSATASSNLQDVDHPLNNGKKRNNNNKNTDEAESTSSVAAKLALDAYLSLAAHMGNGREARGVADNVCSSAWLSNTSTLDSGRQLYYNMGNEDTSPVVGWNLRRRPGQRTIPNPSDCSESMGQVNFETCPGYYMFMEGAEDECDCLEILVNLGYDIELESLLSCLYDRRGRFVSLVRTLLIDDAASAKATSIIPTTTHLGTGAASTTVSSVQWVANEGQAGCEGTFDGSVMGKISSVIVQSYQASGFADASAWDESYVTLTGDGGVTIDLKSCTKSTVTIEVRYAAAGPVGLELSIDAIRVPLSDGQSVLKPTYGHGHGPVVFARGNFVISRPWSSGTHHLVMRRSRTDDAPLLVHRVMVCNDGDENGCIESASAEIYCYVEALRQRFTGTLDTGSGNDNEYDSLQDAVRVCSSRMDCTGINVHKAAGQTHAVFQPSAGEAVATTAEAHRRTVSSFRRQIGPAASNGMCTS